MALIPERSSGPGSFSAAKCLNDAVEQGRMSRAGAEKALASVRRIMEENPGIGEGAAATRAAEEGRIAAAQQKRQAALQAIAQNRMLEDVAAHPDGAAWGAAAVFARDLTGKATYSNVEGRTAAIRGILHAKIADTLEQYRSTALGLRRDVVGLTRLVRELYGESTGDGAAANAARGWREATDYAVDRFNAAGGTIARKQGWNLPQGWDADVVKAAGRGAFLDWMEQAVADGRLRIWDYEANAPVNPLRRAEILSNAWDRISTKGLSDLVPGQGGGTKLANSRADRRAFEWTSADAWLEANRKWNTGDAGIWDLLTGHIDGMAQDIAMLERLGPNPHAAVRVLIDTARKAGATEWQANKLEAVWEHVSGAAASPVSEGIANFFGGIRSWLMSAQLGSAVLSSVADFPTMRATAAWNGISANGVMGEYLRLLNPANAADRKMAVRAGLIADGWSRRAMAAQRSMMEEVGQTLPARIGDFVMRASGMNAHTQAAKWAFGMEFLGALADQAGRGWDAMAPGIRGALQRYGIGAEQWDLIRTKGLFEEEGVRLIHPEQMVRGGGRAEMEAATRLLEMIDAERGFAVLEPGAAERAIVVGRNRPGTWSGEFLRATGQYKSFPITMMTRHAARGIEAYRAGDHGRYMAALAVSLTMAGAFAMQLKAVAQGRDPRDMADWRFWAAAFMQGGGAGILGDFLNSALTRADRSFYMTAIGGPTAGLVDDVMKLTGANIQATAEGKDTHFGRELAQFVRRNTPGSTLWYARLALDRLLWDRVQEIADPDYARSFRRMEQRARQDFGLEFWWGPGDRTPDRAPNLGAVAGPE
ncbi:hypothetical protein M0638_22245 [Roseomonas sp. NAR14]|uniref:Uncharacterized protein n=1 Tax=Roseomonas acroporae TaxID=2937791 RepID=A0A9X1YDM7_9PROT|nr:hypothetical protein [Roseomonas acroporae]MCK8787100.1 hypothetical protein [Roseomonas acroporae]